MLEHGNIFRKCVAGVALALIFIATSGSTLAKSKEIVLHSFTGGNDGSEPESGLIADQSGNFYGTTFEGGASDEGTVFELAPDGAETILHAFTGGTDGGLPEAGLIEDAAGNLFGTTQFGGAYNRGVIFELTPDGTESQLYSFCSLENCTDGSGPAAALTMDKGGNLYGTTGIGGEGCASGCGTVYKVEPDGTETVLHAFTDSGGDGGYPESSLLLNRKGDLIGTTGWGGNKNCGGGCGLVFEITTEGHETILYSFSGTDGWHPLGNLIADKDGNLFGTTYYGGASTNCGGGCGTVFELAPDGVETVLHSFAGNPDDGSYPVSGLIADKRGNLYGTTEGGGRSNGGTVFELLSNGTERVLYSFCSKEYCTDGGAQGRVVNWEKRLFIRHSVWRWHQ